MTYSPSNRVNSFVFYELDTWSQDLKTDFTLKGCFFGVVKLTKNADPGKYSYSSYGFVLDSLHFFHILVLIEVTMLLFLKCAIVHLCILIIRKKTY